MDADVVVRGGTVVDGTGSAARSADIAVAAGVITAIAAPGSLDGVRAVVELDVTARAVAPGFIDAHAHSDLAALLPDQHRAIAEAPLRQGVTTEVCGNCGESPFPRTARFGDAVDGFVRAGLQVAQGGFTSLEQYAARLAAVPMPTNLAPLLGHGTLRGAAMGFDDRAPDADELGLMLRLADQAFAQGVFGLSTGLIYTPGQFAGTPEISALAAVAGRYGAPYVSHLRDEADHVADAVREALRIGETAGTAVHISHHKVAGRTNWGRSEQTLALLDAARAAGRDVTVDVYPYTAGSTALHALLPPWAGRGGPGALLERLRDPAVRERMAADFVTGLPGWQNLVGGAGWDRVVIAGSPASPSLQGLSVAEIAAGTGRTAVDAACDVVAADAARTIAVVHMMDGADVRAIRGWGAAMLGSDGIAVPGKPHPRLAGTFARALRAPDAADPWSGLADRVHRMTGMPADRFRLPGGRGHLRVGGVADIVVFDPAAVRDRASYSDPLLPPAGIEHVLVAGRPSVRDGEITGVRAGRVLRAR